MIKTKTDMYRDIIRSKKPCEQKIPLHLTGAGTKIETQEDKDKKRNMTIIKSKDLDLEKPKPKTKESKISDDKLKKFINFRL